MLGVNPVPPPGVDALRYRTAAMHMLRMDHLYDKLMRHNRNGWNNR